MIDFEELRKASESVVEFYKKNCDLHQYIVVDYWGVRVVRDEAFITTKQPVMQDELLSCDGCCLKNTPTGQ